MTAEASGLPEVGAFAARLEALAADLGGLPLSDIADEHERWPIYQQASARPECHARLLSAVAADPDETLVAAVVVRMVGIDRRDPQRWIALARHERDREYAQRRADEHLILEARGDVPDLTPELIATWTDWLQRGLSLAATAPAVLDLLASHGRTRRIRHDAAAALRTAGRRAQG